MVKLYFLSIQDEESQRQMKFALFVMLNFSMACVYKLKCLIFTLLVAYRPIGSGALLVYIACIHVYHSVYFTIKLMKGKYLKKHSLHEKIAASVLWKLSPYEAITCLYVGCLYADT